MPQRRPGRRYTDAAPAVPPVPEPGKKKGGTAGSDPTGSLGKRWNRGFRSNGFSRKALELGFGFGSDPNSVALLARAFRSFPLSSCYVPHHLRTIFYHRSQVDRPSLIYHPPLESSTHNHRSDHPHRGSRIAHHPFIGWFIHSSCFRSFS